MSTPVRDPSFIGGTPRSSGDVQTGEISWTLGGGRTATVWSGNAVLSGVLPSVPGAANIGGYDLMVYSGGGRLKSVLPLGVQTSGTNITFYDAATVSSGGPFAASGHKGLAFIPGNVQQGNSGLVTVVNYIYQVDAPFQSGLCVALKSGQPPFSFTWIPECSILDNGAVTGA